MPADALRRAERLAQKVAQQSGVGLRASKSAPFGPALHVDAFRLDNGLQILLAPDHRAPVFAYQSWFRVGSRDEDPTRTGLAHLFEHLMFKGTTTYPTGTFDAEMERRGAQTNAATWVDWTYYQQSLAARGDNLATTIAFESDRMRHLVLDEKTFRSELEVVKNERRMAVDNSVGGLLSEALFALAFERHPYRWPTIGSMAHLTAASLMDLTAFYERHYAPDNATVVVCGDVDSESTLLQLARAYGPLQAAHKPRRTLTAEPAQKKGRCAAMIHPVMAPQIVIGFVAPRQSEPEHAAWEMVLTLLTDGDTAPLYDVLVTEKRLASEVSGYLTPFAEPGLLELHIVANEGVLVDEVLAHTWSVLDAFADSLNDSWLQKARNGLLFEHYDGLREVDSIAEALGHFQSNANDFERALDAVGHYQRLGCAELQAAARRAFDRARQNVVVAVAQRKDAGAFGASARWLTPVPEAK